MNAPESVAVAAATTDQTRPIALEVSDLTVQYRDHKRRTVHAVNGVSFSVAVGETLGLVGESGCGKSTIAKAIMGLAPITDGSVRAFGIDLSDCERAETTRYRHLCQMVFQDPISSLNPRRRVGKIVAEGLEIKGGTKRSEINATVDRMLTEVGLDPEHAADRRPHEFSGGQCQRISIARALAVGPELLVCDEPVSALDVSVQAQILNILQSLKAKFSLTMLFIAHDLAVIKNISDRIVVMYLGSLCEVASPTALFDQAMHPYTHGLIESIPRPDPDHRVPRETVVGDVPSPTNLPSGCPFHTRCPRAEDECSVTKPELVERRPGHFVACHFPIEADNA